MEKRVASKVGKKGPDFYLEALLSNDIVLLTNVINMNIIKLLY